MLLLAALALAEPLDVLRAEGCLACHPDGGAGVGPALVGRVGQTQTVLAGGGARSVTIDQAYLRRALTEPGAEGPEGFPLGTMPAVAPAKVDEVLAAVTALTPVAPKSPWWFLGVVAGGLIFAGGHLGMSLAAVRSRLVARWGEGGFMGAYSVVASLGMGLMVWSWAEAPFLPVWDPPAWTRWLPILVMPLVLLGQIAGYSTPAPTVAGLAATVGAEPRGIHRITRHPVNITSAIWAAAHLAVNGDLAGIVMFTSVLILGVVGCLHIDARRAAADPEAWARYVAQTSVLPFVAIAQGRNRLALDEIGLWRWAATLATFVLILWTHQWVMGASPWP